MPTLINSGLRPDYGTFTDGHSYSSSCLERESELIRQSESHIPTDFNGLARMMGYRPGTLRRAIGSVSDRKLVLRRLREAGVKYYDADKQLCDAFCAEVEADACLPIAAE